MVDQQVKVSNDLIAFYTTLNPIVRIRYLQKLSVKLSEKVQVVVVYDVCRR